MKNKIVAIMFLLIACIGITGCPAAETLTNAANNPSSGTGSSNNNNGGGNSGGNQGGGQAAIAAVEITTAPTSLIPGETLQLVAVAKDKDGNVIGSATISFSGNKVHIADIQTNGDIEARYPGQVKIVAEAGGIQSAPWTLDVDPQPNNLNTTQLTDNNVEDHWGANNDFKTTSRGRVLWLQHDNNDMPESVLVADTSGNIEMQHDVSGVDEIDFMALGSGANDDDVMASWRQMLQDTYVSDGANTIINLGDQLQEENGIADGCLFYRSSSVGGTDDNDIAQFDFSNGNTIVSEAGPEDHEPITSECEAIWNKDGDLIYFDGQDETLISDAANFSEPNYDFRHGRIVYVLNGDIYLVDTTTIPFTETQITNNGVNGFPQTDGHSIVWIQDNVDVVLYDIATGTSEVISTTSAIKLVATLQIDGRQVTWMDGTGELFFHDGTGTAAGTSEVDPFPATTVSEPHLSDGVLTWHGPTGVGTDTEIFIML